jgi:Cys-rich protein (TIGR04453 family)
MFAFGVPLFCQHMAHAIKQTRKSISSTIFILLCTTSAFGALQCRNIVEDRCLAVCETFADCTGQMHRAPIFGPIRDRLVTGCMTPCTNYHQEMLACYEDFEGTQGSCQKMTLCVMNSGVFLQ